MKKVTNKVLWLFAIGQLGWSMLSGIISNWLVFYYQPDSSAVKAGQTIFVRQGAIFLGLTTLGVIAAIGRIFDAITDPLIAAPIPASAVASRGRLNPRWTSSTLSTAT